MGVPASSCIPLGFHGDGVPHQRGDTVDVLSWNFAARPTWERYFFGCLEKQFWCRCGCKGRCTLDGMLLIFQWCLRCLWMGSWPECRHDGSPWSSTDSSRQNRKGPFGWCAGLLQVRGDWAFYKHMLSLKGWAGEQICWKCGGKQKHTALVGLQPHCCLEDSEVKHSGCTDQAEGVWSQGQPPLGLPWLPGLVLGHRRPPLL